MAATLCQVMGFLLSLLGVAGIIAATGMDQWATEDLFDNPVTAVYSYSGLWRSCVRQSSGFTECRPYFTILGLPALLQAVRALMIVGIVLGAIGCLIAIFALKCLKMGNMEDNIKATMTLTAGILSLLAGVCGIAGVSAFANLIVQSFRFTTYADGGYSTFGGANVGGLTGSLTPRYTFGPALFVGWIGGAILFIGGVMMCLACRGMSSDGKRRYDGMAYKAASVHTIYKSDTRPHPAYNDSYKAQSVGGKQSNQRFDYV
ncbi:claudin-18-like isoform X1 [Seriola lalandi dorsalis]|uniref:Claudin 18 n=1 Tax=Seriola lalandi dorsalis TaxID=1841481 RepID=A0A3B4WN39_SERLL|nr:claudin-18-like isoform X1 [Seriola lalandi dorsalis]XP_056233703.1 claudin-18-like isoform X2 [Seriola aureovittata]